MKQFVFCHGFGFDKSFWKHLAPQFLHEKSTYFDLGYFNDPHQPSIKNNGDKLIGIGHSLGLLKLLMLNKKFDYLIGLNSFIHFLGYEPKLREKRQRELAILKKHFIQSPTNTLNGFYQRCGVVPNHPAMDKIQTACLLDDLNFLTRDVSISQLPPLLMIGSHDDTIVPPSVLYDNAAKYPTMRVDIMAKGKHSLGFTKARTIHKKILNFIHDVT